MIPIKIGTAFAHPFGPFVSSTDGYTIVSALGIGTTNIRINSNGAAAWVSKSTATTPAYQELGYYLFTFTSTDFATQGHHRVAVSMTSASGALPVWEDFWASETSELAVALTSGARSTAIDLIWDEAVSGHTVAGSAGGNLQSATTAAVLAAAGVNAVTTAIWAEALASHTTAGGAGKKLSDLAMSTDMGTALTNITTIDGIVDAIQAKTTNLPATPASSTGFLGTTGTRDAVWNAVRATYATAGTFGEVTESSDLVDDIWDEALAGHATTATAGERLTAAAAASGLGTTGVRDAVWGAVRSSYATTGTFGDLANSSDMATALANITTIDGIVDTIVAKTTNLPATPASSTSFLNWAMSTDMGTALTNITAIQAKTTNLPATPASSTDAMRLASTAIDLIWDESLAGHATTNTAGERLSAASAAAGLGTTAVRDAVWGAARATYASTGTFGELIDALWDEPIAGHLAAGSVGNALNAAGSAGDPWATAIPGAYTTAQAGGLLPNKLDAIQAKTTNLPSTPASSTSILTWAMSTDMGTALTNIAAIQAKTTNLPAAPASSTQILNWAMSTDMGTALTNITTIDGIVDAIQAKTTNLPATPASSTGFTGLMPSTGTTSIGDAVWSAVNESTQSYADQVRNIRAALVGEAAGGGTASITFRDAADSINRLTFTATTDGNRTAVTILTT